MAVLAQFPTSTKMPVVGITVILGTGGSTGDSIKKVLLVGVGLAAGSKATGTITQVLTGADADTYWGAGSTLARMARRAIDEQRGTLIWGGHVADPATASSTATIVFGAGPASIACSYEITIGRWTVNVALDAAIKAHESYAQMPIVSSVVASTVTLTTKEGHDDTPSQVSNTWQDSTNLDTLTATLTAPAVSGNGTIDIATVLAAAATTRWHYIVVSASDSTNLGKLETHLDTYASALNAKRGQGIGGSMDTPANQITLAQAVNAWRVQILGCEKFMEQHYEIAAAWSAQRQFREASLPSTAYKMYPMKSVAIPHLETEYMLPAEEEAAVNAGITPVVVRNGEAKIPRSITSRSQTSGGAPDYTVLDTSNVTITDACGDDIEADFETRYMIEDGVAFWIDDDPTDGSLPKQFTCTPNLVKYDIWGWMDEWYNLRRIVNPDSPTDYKAQVATSRSGARINAQIPIPAIQGAMIFDVALRQTAG
jgi:phage tail sheath gpL-like